MAGPIIQYQHHGVLVNVREDLKGKHREYCLCHRCGWFLPEDQKKNCRIAKLLFALDVAFGVVTPVWECPEFEDKEQKELT